MTNCSLKPLISIITVNYNGLALTCSLIDSVARNVSAPVEIVVVDNGSKVDEAAEIEKRYPSVKAVRSDVNLGFAGGNNLGIREASGEYLFFLNNDTEIEDDKLESLVDTLKSHPEVGVVCPKIRFFYPPRHIQFAGYTALSRITLRNSLIGFNCEDGPLYNEPAETPYAHGAAMMVRREVIDTAGTMPEMFFLYYEELDWSVRIREAGWKILYDPACTIYHKESATTGKDSPLRRYYLTRNRLLFAHRNLHGLDRAMSVLFLVVVAAPKRAVQCMFKGRRDLAASVCRGVRDYFKMEK